MPRARLRLELPEEAWIGSVSRAHPGARCRVLATLPEGESGIGLVEIAAADVQSVIDDIRTADSIVDLEVLVRHERKALVQFETTMPVLLGPVQNSGIPLEMPFNIQGGEAVWEITTSRARLSDLGDQLDAIGIKYIVEEVSQDLEPERLLTDRQRRVVIEAVDRGYYDTPRECSLTELAAAMDIAKSTCSETLHRAEERIVKRFVMDHLEVELPDRDPARK